MSKKNKKFMDMFNGNSMWIVVPVMIVMFVIIIGGILLFNGVVISLIWNFGLVPAFGLTKITFNTAVFLGLAVLFVASLFNKNDKRN